MKRSPRWPRDISRTRPWVLIVLAIFVAIDIVLISLAVTAKHGALGAATIHPIPTFSSDTGSTAVPSATPSLPANTALTGIAPTRLLAAVDGTTAWRADTGGCPATKATPELTTDSGATWKSTDATTSTSVVALQRLIPQSKSVASMVGLTESGCVPALIKTFVGGDNYAVYPNLLASTWYVVPTDRKSLHSPAGTVVTPCTVLVVAPLDASNSAIWCDNQSLLVTKDGGAHWSQPLTVAGMVNLSLASEGYVAAVLDNTCNGVRVDTFTTQLVATGGGCYSTSVAPLSLAGKVALSGTSAALWLWVGNRVVRSTDGGTTWR